MTASHIDTLAQLIREVDGGHDLGAGALAERLYDKGVRLPLPAPAITFGDGVEDALQDAFRAIGQGWVVQVVRTGEAFITNNLDVSQDYIFESFANDLLVLKRANAESQPYGPDVVIGTDDVLQIHVY